MNKKPTIGAYRFEVPIRVTNKQGEVVDGMKYKDDIQKALDNFAMGNELLPYIQEINENNYEKRYDNYVRYGKKYFDRNAEHNLDVINSAKVSFEPTRYDDLRAIVIFECTEDSSTWSMLSDIRQVFEEDWGIEFSDLPIPTKDGNTIHVESDIEFGYGNVRRTSWDDPKYGYGAPMWRDGIKKYEEENNKTNFEKAVDRLETVVDRFENAVKQLSEIDNTKTNINVEDISMQFEDAIKQLSKEARSQSLEQ